MHPDNSPLSVSSHLSSTLAESAREPSVLSMAMPQRLQRRALGFAVALALMLIVDTPANAGGRYPMRITAIQGEVQVRLEKPGSRWHSAKLGSLEGGTYLLRTGPRSYAHLLGDFRCVDADSLIRIHYDTEASIDVLRGQMSAVDGKRGKSLPDGFSAPKRSRAK